MGRYVNPKPQYLDGNLEVYKGGQLFFFESGTSTPKDTFRDAGLTLVNANPVRLGADGRVPEIFLAEDAPYKVILRTAPTEFNPEGVQIWEVDPVGGETTSGQFDPWEGARNYQENELVVEADKYYRAIRETVNENPTTNSDAWALVRFMEEWNPNISYAIDDFVYFGQFVYFSKTGSNLNNSPDLNPLNWRNTQPDADVNFVSTVDIRGYGVTSASSSSGQLTINFDRAATTQFDQEIQVTQGQTTPFIVSVDYVSTTQVVVYTAFNDGTSASAFPIAVRRNLL